MKGKLVFTIGMGDWDVVCLYDGLPTILSEYQKHALLAEQIDLLNPEGKFCFVAVKRPGDAWPSLVVAQRYEPAESGFYPAALLVSETNRLFVGAGSRLLCYDIAKPARIWEDSATFGFWGWTHDGTQVFMAAELEFTAFDTLGKKLWTRLVEPPWTFTLQPDRILLDVMGNVTHLDRQTGEAL